MKKLKQKLRAFFATENLNAETEEAKVLSWWNLNKTKYPYIASFASENLSAPLSSVYSEILFSEAGNLWEHMRNGLLPKTGEKLLFLHHNLEKLK